MTEDPTPGEPDDEPDEPAESEQPSGDQEGLPPPPSKEELDDIRFAVTRWRDAPLTVTLTGGPIEAEYAPADLLGKVAERIGALVGDLSGGVPPMLYGLVPGESMTLYLGDPIPEEPQTRIPLEATHDAAARVTDLLELGDDELYAGAVQLGPPARRYDELAQLVQSEGFTMKWETRERPSQELTPQRAARHHSLLAAEPEMRVHDVTLNGVLYRVIAQPGRAVGRIGIQLFDWSAPPPGPRTHAPLVAYEGVGLHEAIRDGLIGEPVEAVVRVKQPRPGTAIDPKRVELELASIKRGPGEASALGTSIDEMLDELG